MQDIETIIRKRTSQRSYMAKPIDFNQLDTLKTFIQEMNKGPFKSEVRILLEAANHINEPHLKGLGTYGAIHHPAGFVIGVTHGTPNALIDLGYLLEIVILRFTEMDLGTCWLGASFQKNNFGKHIQIQDDETIPAVVAFGYPSKERTLRDKISRSAVQSKNRNPWDMMFYHGDFYAPLSPIAAGEYASVLEMVRLAPSASNKQPWRIVKANGNDEFYFYVQRSPVRQRFMTISGIPELCKIDIGIAMAHFELALKSKNLKGEWILDNPQIGMPSHSEYIITWRGTF